MRKLSEVKGEEALDVLAEILEPIVTIINDEEVKAGFETNVAKSVSVALKKYKTEILQIFASINGKSVEETCEEIDILSLPSYIVEILNEPEIQRLFT
jgi:hypothetical protein